SRWRIVTVLVLLALPIVFWAVMGSYFLFTLPWGWLAWWATFACFATGYITAYYWQRNRLLISPPSFESVPVYWTERDQQAWKLVEARAKAGEKLDPGKFIDLHHYLTEAQDLAVELAAFYHPGATDPVDNLTVPELLAVAELAAHDLYQMVDQYLPGGHLLT